MNRHTTLPLIAALIATSGALTGITSAQNYAPQPVDGDPVVAGAPFPTLAPEQLDQLTGPIALYPDPLIAQILPASTYPIDVVKAARLVRSGATPETIDAQDWDPSVKAVAHYSSVIEMMDQSIDWTQQLGQAFLSQPDDVMGSIQRLRVQAQGVGNLVNTPQQEVYVEDNAVRIVPTAPDIIYVPTYDPAVVYYQQPVYGGSYLDFSYGYPCGPWFDLDFDWHNHWVYRPGWTWNHWHDNFIVDRDHISRRVAVDPHRTIRPTTVWHRDSGKPLTFRGQRTTRPSDFDSYRGRDTSVQHRPTPEVIHTPTRVDRGRTPEAPPAPSIVNPPGRTDDHGRDNRRVDNRPAQLAPAPAPRAPEPSPARESRPAPPVHAAPPPPASTPPAHVAPPPPATHVAPAPPVHTAPPAPVHTAPPPAVHAAPPPAHVTPAPVHIAPPPAARPSTPAYVQPHENDKNDGRGHH